MPMCPKCGEKWDLADGYDACPNCEGGGSDRTMSRGYQILLWAAAAAILVAILLVSTCSR
jgi:hypothetical protein